MEKKIIQPHGYRAEWTETIHGCKRDRGDYILNSHKDTFSICETVKPFLEQCSAEETTTEVIIEEKLLTQKNDVEIIQDFQIQLATTIEQINQIFERIIQLREARAFPSCCYVVIAGYLKIKDIIWGVGMYKLPNKHSVLGNNPLHEWCLFANNPSNRKQNDIILAQA